MIAMPLKIFCVGCGAQLKKCDETTVFCPSCCSVYFRHEMEDYNKFISREDLELNRKELKKKGLIK